MDTLTERIQAAAEHASSITFVSGDAQVTLPWAQLHDEARGVAAALAAEGVRPGDHVALLGPTTRELVTTIQAIWLAGATVVALPLPMRLASIEEFVAQTRERIARADVRLLVIDPQLSAFVEPEEGDPARIELDALATEGARLGGAAWSMPAQDPNSLAILQFTSGSTSEPKGVMLPHHTILANLDAIAERGKLDLDNDCFVSWLPLYHDMGLVGLLGLPMISGTRMVLGAPQDFTGRPSRWMEWISEHAGTVTAGPNFAWALAARSLRRSKETLDLSHLRVALNGAEPIDPTSVRELIDAGARHGLRPGAIFPAFGMAEVAIAGTFPDPMAGLRTDPVDRGVLENERYAAPAPVGGERTREFALLGRPMAGLEMRVVDPATGHELADREVGELELRGTSVTPGYYRNAEATEAMFRDGWLRTGDLAYTLGAELVLCGRIKDVIIVGGRNIFPEDVERAAAAVEGVRPGNVIAFGVEGRRGAEAFAVVAEIKGESNDVLQREVHDRVRDACGHPPHDVVLVPAGTLPKTSSGKLQRSLCRQRYLDGTLEPVNAG
ncbi:MAG: AMP-binding protein [Acidimicrobiia bacterium]|nr:AMP-binding protein [Acidimicrobiia bacterium]